jgi:hypothetical protein
LTHLFPKTEHSLIFSLFKIADTRAQQAAMDAAAAQALANAIAGLPEALTAALIPQVAPAAPVAAAPTMVSPYEGNALDLSSRVGQSLYEEGGSPLDNKFTGRIEDYHLFMSDL